MAMDIERGRWRAISDRRAGSKGRSVDRRPGFEIRMQLRFDGIAVRLSLRDGGCQRRKVALGLGFGGLHGGRAEILWSGARSEQAERRGGKGENFHDGDCLKPNPTAPGSHAGNHDP